MSYLNDLLALSHVPRWAIVRTYRPQSVGEHSFRTAMIAAELWRRTRIKFPGLDLERVMWLSLTHDADESVTGDIPGIVKPELHITTEFVAAPLEFQHLIPTLQEIKFVKVCDLLETSTFIEMEGHGYHANQVIRNLQVELISATEKLDIADEVRRLHQHIVDEDGRFRWRGDVGPRE